jgi:hypothetical protein
MFGLATQLFINEEVEKVKTIFETIVFNRAHRLERSDLRFDSQGEHEIIYSGVAQRSSQDFMLFNKG